MNDVNVFLPEIIKKAERRLVGYLEKTGYTVDAQNTVDIVSVLVAEKITKVGSLSGFLTQLKYKKQAKRLKKFFESRGTDIKMGHSFDAISVMYGHMNWNTLLGMAKRESEEGDDSEEKGR
jgi:hypothetical protein